jgi:hypothetical protein
MIGASRVTRLLDAAELVLLRDVRDGAETVSSRQQPVKLPNLQRAYWTGAAAQDDRFSVALHVSDMNADAVGSVISINIDDTPDHSNAPVAVASCVIGGPGGYTLAVDHQALTGNKDRWINVSVSLPNAGSPSITYGAWIAKSD